MNKKYRSLLTGVMTLSMLLGAAAPLALATTSNEDSVPSKVNVDKPDKADLVIHKVQYNESGALPTIPDHNGEETSIPGTSPVEGAGFTVYKADGLAVAPKTADGLEVAEDEAFTDANGTLRLEDLPAGRYLVVETKTVRGTNLYSPPFLVDLPMTNAEGTSWLDEVHVYAKNQIVLGSVAFEKYFELSLLKDIEAEFGIWKVKNEGDLPSGESIEKDTATPADPEVYFDANGLGLETGWYVIKELSVTAPYGVNEDLIYFEVTTDDHDNDLTDNEASIHPLAEEDFDNWLLPTDPEKDNLDNDDTANFHEQFTWSLTSRIPMDIADYEFFDITDVLHEALDYENNLKILIDGSEVTPAVVADIAEPAEDHGGTLVLTFKPEELAAYAGKKLEVRFDTSINDNAVMGEDIKNSFDLDYHNGHTEYNKKSPSAKTETGGEKFDKTSTKGDAILKGAQFWIYNSEGDYLQKDYSWKAEGASGWDPMVLTSDENGNFEIKGLAYGTYTLEERVALPGHVLREDLEFTVNESSYSDEKVIEVLNAPKMELPSTGGMGTIIFTIAGASVMAGAVKLYRKEEKE